jgi:hypothetical protein
MQGLLQSLLQTPEQQQQAEGVQNVNLLSQQNPLAATLAYMMPQRNAGMERGVRGLFGLPQQMTNAETATANGASLTTSDGLKAAAQNAMATGNRPLALQFTLQAQELAKAEAQSRQTLARQQLQRSTAIASVDAAIAGVDEKRYPGLASALEGYKSTLAAQESPDPDKVQTTLTSMFDRAKVDLPVPEAGLETFTNPAGELITYPVDKQGNVVIPGVGTVNPASRGLVLAPNRTASTVREDKPVSPAEVDWAVRTATELNLLPGDPGSPVSRAYLAAIDAGKIQSREDITKHFEEMAGTPRAIAQQNQFRANVLTNTSGVVANVDEALSFVRDPQANIGPTWTIMEGWPVGSDANDFASAIESVVSTEALAKIQELKVQAQQVGATGTGLGQVAVREFEALANSRSNLSRLQGRERIEGGLNEIKYRELNVAQTLQGKPVVIVKDDPAYRTSLMVAPATGQTYIDMGIGDPVPAVVVDNVSNAISILEGR